jgi:hypothetical protein
VAEHGTGGDGGFELACVEPALECQLQTVSQERDEDMSLDPTFVLMEDRTNCEVALQVFECLFHGSKRDVVQPQQRGDPSR